MEALRVLKLYPCVSTDRADSILRVAPVAALVSIPPPDFDWEQQQSDVGTRIAFQYSAAESTTIWVANRAMVETASL